MGLFKINNNAAANTALNTVSATSDQLTNLQRQLSTGKKDLNPAELIKSETFRTQIAGVTQAKANAQEGVNYVKTADAQLNEINTLLQNGRQLAIQAANTGTSDDDQRNALNSQLQRNIAAINQIASGAAYGTKKLLDGTAGVSSIGVTANTDFVSFTGSFNGKAITTNSASLTTVTTTTAATDASYTGNKTYASSSTVVDSGATHTVTINGTAVTTTTSTTAAQLASAITASAAGVTATYDTTNHVINIANNTAGASALLTVVDNDHILSALPTSVNGTAATAATSTGTATYALATTVVDSAAGHTVTINGHAVTYTQSNTVTQFVAAINAVAAAGVTASYDAVNHVIDITNNATGSANTLTIVDPDNILSLATPTITPGTNGTDTVYTGNKNYAASTTVVDANAGHTITINSTAVSYTAGQTVSDLVASINASALSGTLTAAYDSTNHVIKLTNNAVGSSAITVTDNDHIISGYSAVVAGTNAVTSSSTTVGEVDLKLTTAAAPATLTGATVGSYTSLTQPVAASGSLTINGSLIGNYSTSVATDTVSKVINDIKNSGLGLTASLSSNKIIITSNNVGSNQKIALVDTGGIISAAGTSTVTGVDAVADVTVGTSTVTFNKGKGLLLQDADGNQINLSSVGNSTGLTLGTKTNVGQLTIGSSAFCIDSNNAQPINISLKNSSASYLGRGAVSGVSLSNIDFTTDTNIGNALKVLDQAIKDISSSRASLKSIQVNTLEPAIRSLTVTKENLQSSESDMTNLNIAEGITEMTKYNILNSSGLAQLAQANQLPQSVLNLMRG